MSTRCYYSVKNVFFLFVLGLILPMKAQEIQSLTDGNNTFALALYKQLKSEPKNLFFSPYSISTALAMTYAGARGNTAQQIAKVFCFSKTGEAIHSDFALLAKHLKKIEAPPKILLEIANALWPSEQLTLLPEFLEITKKYYGTAVFPLNFSEVQVACDAINRWAEEKTHHKIKDLVSPMVIDAGTQLVLTNAIYFKGAWKTAFDPKETKNLPFWITSEKSQSVPMMRAVNKKFRVMGNDDLQILELPYERESLSMLILLPSQKDLTAFESSLNTENLSLWKQQLLEQEIPIYLPKFKITAEFSLGDSLAKMGMVDAFRPGKADFSGIDGEQTLFISAVVHKAFVEITEEGTEAAAATAVAVGRGGPPKKFLADHPFIFLIQENSTGNILFIGRLLDPTS